MEFNVAQMRSVEDLGLALNTVGSASHGKTPLVFFDELDCAFQGRELGWLQYFLAPMDAEDFLRRVHRRRVRAQDPAHSYGYRLGTEEPGSNGSAAVQNPMVAPALSSSG